MLRLGAPEILVSDIVDVNVQLLSEERRHSPVRKVKHVDTSHLEEVVYELRIECSDVRMFGIFLRPVSETVG